MSMSRLGLIFWATIGALGFAALSSLVEPEVPVMTLEGGLGQEIKTSRL